MPVGLCGVELATSPAGEQLAEPLPGARYAIGVVVALRDDQRGAKRRLGLLWIRHNRMDIAGDVLARTHVLLGSADRTSIVRDIVVDQAADIRPLQQRGVRRAIGEPGPGDAVMQLKISLIGVTKPPVWRRLLVPADIRLDRLHELIQTAMGWCDCHMHVFSVAGVEYGLPDPELDFRDERKTTLDRVLGATGERMRYTYDFGDDWEHEIVVEKLLSAEAGVRYPTCIAGRSRCPPEDCGGAWGYRRLRETLADPRDEEHTEMLEWLGLTAALEFDPTDFDVDEVNAVL
ncbi:MAG: plasmid pRiA4b ORF-3 family protein [Solirubrobacteraceae bacterium]